MYSVLRSNTLKAVGVGETRNLLSTLGLGAVSHLSPPKRSPSGCTMSTVQPPGDPSRESIEPDGSFLCSVRSPITPQVSLPRDLQLRQRHRI